MEFHQYRDFVKSIPIGKQLPDAVYLHESAIDCLPRPLGKHIAQSIIDLGLDEEDWNILKFFKRDHKIALLNYPEFFEDSYPCLHQSFTVDLEKSAVRKSDYTKSDNPPILHRKETFLDPDHPAASKFREITEEGERAGLYTNTRSIGLKKSWERLIARKGYALVDGRLKPLHARQPTDPNNQLEVDVERHLTAIDRNRLSQPLQILARHDYLNGDYSMLDYGCGKGDDVRELEAHGIDVTAWDPIHQPDGELRKSDIVNLGFVINVIEDRAERVETLKKAYSYAKKFLVVSAMIGGESTISKFRPYKDGIITSRNTFQKYYSQPELSGFIEASLDEKPVALAPGIFAVFRDKLEEQRFLVERQHVRRTWRKLTQRDIHTSTPVLSETQLKQHRALFEDFWNTALDLGRIPANDEFEHSEEIRRIAGSHRKAFDALVEREGSDLFEKARLSRRDDLLVYFALSLFGRRPAYTKMPERLKRDLKALFGPYQEALKQAKSLLFSVANSALIEEASLAAQTRLGYGHVDTGHSLSIHRSAINQLPPVLRVYVGCAEQLYGDAEDIDLVKIHFKSGKVTFQKYDNFSDKPLPMLVERIKVDLKNQDIHFFDYNGKYLPQPLYLKSRLIPTTFEKFNAQLSFDQQLIKLGLFDLSNYGPSKTELDERLKANLFRVRDFCIINDSPDS